MDKLEAKQRYDLAKTLHTSGKHAEALALLDEVIKAFPNQPNILYSRALCLKELGRIEEARSLCEQLDIVFGDPRGAQLRAELGTQTRDTAPTKGGKAAGGQWRLLAGAGVAAVCVIAGIGTAVNYAFQKEEPAAPPPQSRLRILTLGGNPLDDQDMPHLANLTALERLDLQNTQVSDAGLAHLQKLTRLQEVQLAGTRVTPSGQQQLQQALPNTRIIR